jgi:hypothetical protein
MEYNMIEVGLIDKSFWMCGPSAGTGSTKKSPKLMKWVPHQHREITVFTDYCLEYVDSFDVKYKIAYLLEPRSIIPHIYEKISDSNFYNKFNIIMTHDQQLLSKGSIFKFVPTGGHWIFDEDCKIHNKSKLVSIIASEKNQTLGHQLRHQVVSKYQNQIDGIFGRHYNFIENKIDGLRDYRFHIVIENAMVDDYFTEKLIDAFITGCVPIYYGTKNIGNYFDIRGIIQVYNIDDFKNVMKMINDTLYSDLLNLGIIQENFERAKEYMYPEDYMYQNILKVMIQNDSI